MPGPKTLHGLTFFPDWDLFVNCSQISLVEVTTQGQNFRVEIEMDNGNTFNSDLFGTQTEAQDLAEEIRQLTNNIFPYPYPE